MQRIKTLIQPTHKPLTPTFLKKCFMIHFLLLTAAWLVCLAVYYPGVGMNDGLNILAGRLASANQFPIYYCIYVVILGKIGNLLGSLQYAVAIYSVLQIIITAAICAMILTFLWEARPTRLFHIIVSAYYLLCPLLAVYSITMVKDTVFASLLVLYGILMYQASIESVPTDDAHNTANHRNMLAILFIVSSLMLNGLRSNGLYIVIVCLIWMWFTVKPYRKTVLITVVLLIIMNLCASAIMNHYDVRHNSSETLGIPIQQICAVVAEDGQISNDDLETLAHFIDAEDIKQLYMPGDADPVKWSDAFNRKYLNTHVGEFLSLWLRLLPQNLPIYVKAYLQQTYWFWCPDPRGNVMMFNSIEIISDNYWLAEFLTQNGIHDAPILTGAVGSVLRTYYQLGSKFPREGVCLWIMIVSMIIARLRKYSLRSTLACYLPQILCWLTIMVSTPINQSFRYVLYYAYAMPVYLLFVTSQAHSAEYKS